MEAFEKRVNDFILDQIRKAREINQEYQAVETKREKAKFGILD